MADYCTCGAQLVPGALFCHKCGKPQREILAAEPEQVPPPPPPAEAAAPSGPPPINFRNRVAVRTAMLCAGVASLLLYVPLPVFLAAVWMLGWLLAAGFVAVYLYHRRTGEFLSVKSGAHMGWITGLFCFLIALITLVLGVISVSGKGDLADFYREQLRNQAAGGANVEEALRLLESPAGFAALVFTALLFTFLMFTGLPTIGGALGAKVLEKE